MIKTAFQYDVICDSFDYYEFLKVVFDQRDRNFVDVSKYGYSRVS